jgi:hypothetical protein
MSPDEQPQQQPEPQTLDIWVAFVRRDERAPRPVIEQVAPERQSGEAIDVLVR